MMEEFSYKEQAILEQAQVYEAQARNMGKILNSPLPRKKEKFYERLYGSYIVRQRNSAAKAAKILEKHGYVRKGQR